MGNTKGYSLEGSPGAVHPHVCGEYAIQNLMIENGFGSPPRVWGIHLKTNSNLAKWRFTPTCVGNTHTKVDRRIAVTVHPHVCGEYVSHSDPSQTLPGSPPRVWGIRAIGVAPVGRPRFTPTCVGNTPHCRKRAADHSVHPHVCGEYLLESLGLHCEDGSPPRVWGIR